jgi:acyl-CoA synthetase (AMP-forming)/AMP-acid ligase II
MNLASNLERSVFFPDRPALHEEGRELTYRQLNGESDRIAAGLVRMGIRPGGFMVICKPNSAQTVDRDRHETAAILYTGGTTGNPKGAQLLTEYPHALLMARRTKLARLHEKASKYS